MLNELYRHVLLPPVRWTTRNDAETAHEWFLQFMGFVERHRAMQTMLSIGFQPDPLLHQTLLDGLEFVSPFGVAAGLDKNAAIMHSVNALMSPGFIEIGTVTPLSQVGNPRPRIVRVGKDNLINAMGFPSNGIDVVVRRLDNARPLSVPVGLNIGKQKETTEDDAPAEYARLIAATAELQAQRKLPDFYVVNVSSPNTPGLTAMQKADILTPLLTAVVDELDKLSTPECNQRHRLLVKLGPDLELDAIDPIVELVLSLDMGGLVTTNTTSTRPVSSRHDSRPGGFSGSALFDRSARVIRHVASILPANKVLVATGGIDTIDRAYEMLRYADLVGGYTGLVLQGPRLFRELHAGVAGRMRAEGIESLLELRRAQRPPKVKH